VRRIGRRVGGAGWSLGPSGERGSKVRTGRLLVASSRHARHTTGTHAGSTAPGPVNSPPIFRRLDPWRVDVAEDREPDTDGSRPPTLTDWRDSIPATRDRIHRRATLHPGHMAGPSATDPAPPSGPHPAAAPTPGLGAGRRCWASTRGSTPGLDAGLNAGPRRWTSMLGLPAGLDAGLNPGPGAEPRCRAPTRGSAPGPGMGAWPLRCRPPHPPRGCWSLVLRPPLPAGPAATPPWTISPATSRTSSETSWNASSGVSRRA
jgi:hypothetical protein